MAKSLSPDDIAGAQTVSVGLHIGVMRHEDEAEDFVLVQGSRDALRFLGELIFAVADSDSLPADFSIGPRSAGQFHFADSATEAIYIRCTESSDDIELRP